MEKILNSFTSVNPLKYGATESTDSVSTNVLIPKFSNDIDEDIPAKFAATVNLPPEAKPNIVTGDPWMAAATCQVSPRRTPNVSSTAQMAATTSMAQIMQLNVSKHPDGSYESHSIVRIPKDINIIEPKSTLKKVSVEITKNYTKAKMAKSDRQDDLTVEGASTYNLVMVDTSGSMDPIFNTLVQEWNYTISPHLDGETDIYSFSDEVEFKRTGTEMSHGDFIGRNTNLTEAIQKIGDLITICPYKHIRIFLITDGDHNAPSENYPQDEIPMLIIPNKRIEVYVLGITERFPVQISVLLRSKLHTGAVGCPTLYWVRRNYELRDRLQEIKLEMKAAVNVKVSIPFRTMPYHNEKRSAYPGEYLYFDVPPQRLLSSLKLTVEKEEKVRVPLNWRRRQVRSRGASGRYAYHYVDRMMMMRSRRRMIDHDDCYYDDDDGYMDYYDEDFERLFLHRGRHVPSRPRAKKTDESVRAVLAINSNIQLASAAFLMNNTYKQWCSILTQMHRNKQQVPMKVFDLMEKAFHLHLEPEIAQVPQASLLERNVQKEAKALKMMFQTLMKESRDLINVETVYRNQIELAEAVLKTTVQSKYDTKLLQIRGHSDPAWETDLKSFMLKHGEIEDRLKQLPAPVAENCCRILMTSFLGDLQDPNFKDLRSRGKNEFLQEMTFTGIPVYAPVKNFSQINPWTLLIKNICVSPFEILSQRAMESSLALSNTNVASDDKEIQLMKDDPGTIFNIIVPVLPKEHAQVLKPLVRTNVFAVACSFCILKNAHIIDRNCHMAALGCVWMKTIRDFPSKTRPEYIKNRIANIEATANLYMDRMGYLAYAECVLMNPEQAVCTEAKDTFKDATIKCESLVKPAFFMHLNRNNLPLLRQCEADMSRVLQCVLAEFMGRCINTKDSATPFVDYYLPTVAEDVRECWVEEKAKAVLLKLSKNGEELLKKYYEQDSLKKDLKQAVTAAMEGMKEELDWVSLCQQGQVVRLEREQQQRQRRYSVDSYDSYGEEEDILMEEDEEKVEEIVNPASMPFIAPKPNMEKIAQLHNFASAGNLMWADLRAWAEELLSDMGLNVREDYPDDMPYLIKEDIDYAFGEDMVTSYLTHALTHRTSRARAEHPLPTPAEARKTLLDKINQEWRTIVDGQLRPKVETGLEAAWVTAYAEAHADCARPLSRRQLVEEARRLGRKGAEGQEITEENVDALYRYRANVGLSRDSCHNERCPHYLVPSPRAHLHFQEQRRSPDFPHGLHLAVSRQRNPPTDAAVQMLLKGTITGTHSRQPHPLPSIMEGQLRVFVHELQGMYTKMGQI